jgi:hypothetical protein
MKGITMKRQFNIIADGKVVAAFYMEGDGPGMDEKAIEAFNSETWPEGSALYEVHETFRQIHPRSTATWEPASLILKDDGEDTLKTSP